MLAYGGEILTLRPVGFDLDVKAIDSFMQRVLGAYRHSEVNPWVIVRPATDLPRLIAATEASNSSTRRSPNMTQLTSDFVGHHPGKSLRLSRFVDGGDIAVVTGVALDALDVLRASWEPLSVEALLFGW